LNQTTTFDLINVTKISTLDLKVEIAQISNDGNVNQISADDSHGKTTVSELARTSQRTRLKTIRRINTLSNMPA
jgi:hypothetical protein